MRTYADTGKTKQTYPSFPLIRVLAKLRSNMVSQLSSSNWNYQQQAIYSEVSSEIYISEEEIHFHHHYHQHYQKDSLENNSTTYRVIGDYGRQSGLGVAWVWRGNNGRRARGGGNEFEGGHNSSPCIWGYFCVWSIKLTWRYCLCGILINLHTKLNCWIASYWGGCAAKKSQM